MRSPKFLLLIAYLVINTCVYAQKEYYFPEKGKDWQQKPPSEFDIDDNKLEEAIQFALENEYKGSRDLRQAILKGFEREPFHKIAGPTKKRGGPSGIILKNGYIVAQWGDTKRVDMTFSVTKSYLSTLAGLAIEEKLIRSVNDSIKEYVWDGKFDGDHNSKIIWKDLLNQSSDWSGELWGMYDWADRPPRGGNLDSWRYRELNEPGSYFKYNDVRVNLLSYCLLQVWRQALPQLLNEKIMKPIGASTTWRWFGYDNSWVTMDGIKMQSVSGGGHSGGGLFINTEDHARYGLLFLNRGKWEDKQLINSDWIELATTPSPANKNYGFMWWLNPDGDNPGLSNISKNAYYASGFGGNYIIIEPDHDLVIVVRWFDTAKTNEFVKMIMDSLK
ncbi:MAG: serine hydrolase [Bacteroidales bacterium]|nr:serine hydrolase [Bacteroidales bacterium]